MRVVKSECARSLKVRVKEREIEIKSWDAHCIKSELEMLRLLKNEFLKKSDIEVKNCQSQNAQGV